MTPKELLYIDDAMGHAQFLTNQCREAAGKLTDPALKLQVQQMAERHAALYSKFYNLT